MNEAIVSGILHELVDLIIPISICVVLPVLVVYFLTRSRVRKNEQQMNVLLKAIENGVEIDPSLLIDVNRKKDPRTSMLNHLRSGVFFLLFGLISLILYFIPSLSDLRDVFLTLWVIALPAGICFLVWCYAGMKLGIDKKEEE